MVAADDLGDVTISCDLSVLLTDHRRGGGRDVDWSNLTDWRGFLGYDTEGTCRIDSVRVVNATWSVDEEDGWDARVELRMLLTFVDSEYSADDHCYWMDSDWYSRFHNTTELRPDWSVAGVAGTSRPAVPRDLG